MRWILILLIIIVAVVIVQNQRNSCEWFQDDWIDCLMGDEPGAQTPAAGGATPEPAAEPGTQPQ